MAYYKTCPHCGAHLDPGETCDCVKDTGAEFSEDDLISFAAWMKNSTTEWRRFGSIFNLHYSLTPEEQYIVFRTAARLANFGMTEEERALTTTENLNKGARIA